MNKFQQALVGLILMWLSAKKFEFISDFDYTVMYIVQLLLFIFGITLVIRSFQFEKKHES